MKKLKLITFISLILLLFVSISACGKKELAAPFDIIMDEDYRLSWSEVNEARSYTVEIKVVDGETVEETSRKAYYSLADLAEGDYEVKVKAIGDGINYEDSLWSETLYFHKEYESGCIYRLYNGSEYQLYKIGSATGDVIIEDYYRGKPVTQIADYAFKGSNKLKKVVIGNNVKSIGESAFSSCANLSEVIFSDSVNSIDVSAFQSCYSLKSVVLPKLVTIINKYTFAYCENLENVTIGENVTQILESAFSGCKTLGSIIIPDSVVYIGTYAFSSTNKMNELVIGSGLEQIDDNAFYNTLQLSNILFSEQSSLKTIGEGAFSGNNTLSSIAFPEGLEEIGQSAFAACTNLTDITIPESVYSIGSHAFFNTKLYNDAIADGQSYIYADKWLIGCSDSIISTLIILDESTLVQGTVGIAGNVFYNADYLQTVTLAPSIKSISEYAFFGCDSLWKIQNNVDSKLKFIGSSAFQDCINLSRVLLKSGLETISSYAFSGCVKLANNTQDPNALVPVSVTFIGTKAFNDTLLWDNPDSTGVIYAGNWIIGYSDISDSITINENVVGIGQFAFYQATDLASIKGLENILYINSGAFYGCISLGTITLNSNLKSIEPYTFYGCSNLNILEMPEMLTSIGRSAFYECKNLSTVNLSKTKVTYIGAYAFTRCINIKEFKFNKLVQNIDSYAFYGCTGLITLKIPDSLETIGRCAFYGNTNLQLVEFGNGLISIGDKAFYRANLMSINITDSVESIGNYAFYGNENADELYLGKNVKSIGNYAFCGLKRLTAVTIPDNVKNIGIYAFKGNSSLSYAFVSSNVESIGENAFYGCDNLTIFTNSPIKSIEDVKGWNSSYRPVIFNASQASNDIYIEYLTLTDGWIINSKASGDKIPYREGYTFVGWSPQANSKEAQYSFDDLLKLPADTIVYAVWQEES